MSNNSGVQQQQQHPSEEVVTKNSLVADKQLKQDSGPAISITTITTKTGPSGITTQCMSSGYAQ